MEQYAFNDWIPYEVTAEDGAITTVFQLTGNTGVNHKGSILLNHGSFMDATTWFIPSAYGYEFKDGDLPLPILLWE